MLVQPLDDAAVERLELSPSAQQAAVMLQKACAFVEAGSPGVSGPIGTTCRRCGVEGSIFSGFSSFSSGDPCGLISEMEAVRDDRISSRLVFRIRRVPC